MSNFHIWYGNILSLVACSLSGVETDFRQGSGVSPQHRDSCTQRQRVEDPTCSGGDDDGRSPRGLATREAKYDVFPLWKTRTLCFEVQGE